MHHGVFYFRWVESRLPILIRVYREHMIEYGRNILGRGLQVFEPVILGFPSRERMHQEDFPGARIGDNAVLRSGIIIYCDVEIGDGFQCGHTVLIRERMRIGKNTAVGSSSVIEGYGSIGDEVRIQSMVLYPPTRR